MSMSPQVVNTAFPTHPMTQITTALPPKLVKKILDLEFIDMAELVPNAWQHGEENPSGCCSHTRQVPKRGTVTDILLWQV